MRGHYWRVDLLCDNCIFGSYIGYCSIAMIKGVSSDAEAAFAAIAVIMIQRGTVHKNQSAYSSFFLPSFWGSFLRSLLISPVYVWEVG